MKSYVRYLMKTKTRIIIFELQEYQTKGEEKEKRED